LTNALAFLVVVLVTKKKKFYNIDTRSLILMTVGKSPMTDALLLLVRPETKAPCYKTC